MLKLSKLERHGDPTFEPVQLTDGFPEDYTPNCRPEYQQPGSGLCQLFFGPEGGQERRTESRDPEIMLGQKRAQASQRSWVTADAVGHSFLQVSNRYLYLPPTGHG